MTIRSYYGLNQTARFDPSIVYTKKRATNPTALTEHVNSTRMIGIEVEVENHAVTRAPTSGVWNTEADGSLRNSGIEYITRPIAAQWGPDALYELLGESLDKNECCFSPRTSIHVHVNMQDEEEEAVIRVLLLYTLFEKLFFRFTGRGRAKNIYCVPIQDTECLKSAAKQAIDATRQQWSKYSALNILPLSEYGTIEFRHMHGTFDYHKVCIWLRLITKLCDYACNMKNELSIGEDVDYGMLLHTIFGPDAQHLKYNGIEDVKDGYSRLLTAYVNPQTAREVSALRGTATPYFQAA